MVQRNCELNSQPAGAALSAPANSRRQQCVHFSSSSSLAIATTDANTLRRLTSLVVTNTNGRRHRATIRGANIGHQRRIAGTIDQESIGII